MGLGVYVSSKLPSSLKLKRESDRQAYWAAMAGCLARSFTDEFEQRLLHFQGSDEGLEAGIDPGAEPILLQIEDGRLRVSAKTSGLGPGYHARVVELLEGVEREFGLSFDWDGDETGYARLRDFEQLRAHFAEFLAQLARSVRQASSDADGCVAVNWQIGASMPECPSDWEAVTSSGPLTRDWITRAMAAPDHRNAAGFYPWWNRGRDAHYWSSRCRALLWSEIPWRPPLGEFEAQSMQSAIDAAERARSLDPAILLPEQELDEVRALLSTDPDEFDQPPAPEGIGYARREVRHLLPGGWSLKLPGYYFHEWTDEGATAAYWFADRAVHVGSLSLDGPGATARDLAAIDRSQYPDGARYLEHDAGHQFGQAAVFADTDEEGESTLLQGQMAVAGSVAIVTITLSDPSDLPWAEEVFRSVSHPDPASEPQGV